MDLFTTFSSKDNLKMAFSYLKDEIDESSLPLDPIWRPAVSAVSELGDEFFDALQEYLRENKYQPDRAAYVYADKDNRNFHPWGGTASPPLDSGSPKGLILQP